MENIIVAFGKEDDAKNFKSILLRKGFSVAAVCTSGAQALSMMEDLGNGVVLCGYRLNDMIYSELSENLPSYFQMLLIASPTKVDGGSVSDNTVFLPTPLHTDELVSSLNIMLERNNIRRKKLKEAKRNRTDEERETIRQAKALLMERHEMTEPQAHKYLQKCSMDSGTDIVETAEMIISLTSI